MPNQVKIELTVVLWQEPFLKIIVFSHILLIQKVILVSHLPLNSQVFLVLTHLDMIMFYLYCDEIIG